MDLHHWEQALSVYSLSPYPVHVLCFQLTVEVVRSQLPAVLHASPQDGSCGVKAKNRFILHKFLLVMMFYHNNRKVTDIKHLQDKDG